MSPRVPRQQLTILEAMVLIAGVAFGLWLIKDPFNSSDPPGVVIVTVEILGGLSIAGAPMMLLDRFRHSRKWRTGAFVWFGLGLVSWGLVPAITIERLNLGKQGGVAPICYIYMLPLMSLFFLTACAISGRPVRQWWTCRGWWPEWVGMYVLVGLAVVGVYLMYGIYAALF